MEEIIGKQSEPFDESFATLLSIGILVVSDAIDLAGVKKLFADAILNDAVDFEELRRTPEFREALRKVNQAVGAAPKDCQDILDENERFDDKSE